MELTLPRMRQIVLAIENRVLKERRLEDARATWQTKSIMKALAGTAFSAKAAKGINRMADRAEFTTAPSGKGKKTEQPMFDEDGEVVNISRENQAGSFEKLVHGFR